MADQNDTPPEEASIDVAGYGLAIAGAALFSTKGIFIKLAYTTGIGTETVLALRMLVAFPFYLAIGAWVLATSPELRARLSPGEIAAAAGVGILGYYVASSLDFWGLSFITAQYERLVLFTYPFFTLALGVLFFGDRMNWGAVPGLVMSYAGLLVIMAWNFVVNPDGLLAGTVLVLGAAVSFALFQHLAKRRMAVIGTRAFTCIAMGAAALVALAHNTVQHGIASYAAFSGEIWFYGACLGIVGTVLPSFLLNSGIQRIGARATSSTAAFGPIATIALAVVVLGEAFTVWHALGTTLVVLGVAWFSRAEHRAKTPAPIPATPVGERGEA